MKFLILMSIVTIARGSSAEDSVDSKLFFRKDYVYMKEFNSFYKAHYIPQNWTRAVAQCREEEAELLLPNSQTEANTAKALIADSEEYIWISIHDWFSDGEFVTLNGTNANEIYTKWNTGEPSLTEEENCVEMLGNGLYNDAYCSLKRVFVCKKSAVEIYNQHPKCGTNDYDFIYFAKNHRCYKFHSEPKSWFDAFKKCNNEESKLAIINSYLEANILVSLFNKYRVNAFSNTFDKDIIHLGFSNYVNPEAFMTIEGKLISNTGYSEWEQGKPTYQYDERRCGSMLFNGKLTNSNCSKSAMFICEKTPSITL